MIMISYNVFINNKITFKSLRNKIEKRQRGLKASSHIEDTTRHDRMRHDPFFSLPIHSNG